MKIFQVLSTTTRGVDAVTLVRAKTKRQALQRFRTIVRQRKFSGRSFFYPDDGKPFKFRGQKPMMGSVSIYDSTKETVIEVSK